MAITVPVAGTEINAATFGKPVADEVNRLSPIVDAHTNSLGKWASDTNMPTGGMAGVTIPKGSTYVDITPLVAVPSTRIPCIGLAIMQIMESFTGAGTIGNTAFQLVNSSGTGLCMFYDSSTATGAKTLNVVFPIRITSALSLKIQGRNSAGSSLDCQVNGDLHIVILPTLI